MSQALVLRCAFLSCRYLKYTIKWGETEPKWKKSVVFEEQIALRVCRVKGLSRSSFMSRNITLVDGIFRSQ